MSKRKEGASVSFTVIMGMMGCIDVPFNLCKRVSRESKAQATCRVKVAQDAFEFTPVILIRGFDAGGEKSNSRLDIPMDAGEKKKLGGSVMKSTSLFFGENLAS